jgi:hypothetical protein
MSQYIVLVTTPEEGSAWPDTQFHQKLKIQVKNVDGHLQYKYLHAEITPFRIKKDDDSKTDDDQHAGSSKGSKAKGGKLVKRSKTAKARDSKDVKRHLGGTTELTAPNDAYNKNQDQVPIASEFTFNDLKFVAPASKWYGWMVSLEGSDIEKGPRTTILKNEVLAGIEIYVEGWAWDSYTKA